MPEPTPSRKKFAIARRLAAELHKLSGDNLRTVLVGGSVATNTAMPNSDIDMVVVYNNDKAKTVYGNLNTIIYEASKAKEAISVWAISAKTFESYGTPMRRRFLRFFDITIPERLLYCALPVFGHEYANKHKSCWNRPTLKIIRKKYPRSIGERVKYKPPGARKRFVK